MTKPLFNLQIIKKKLLQTQWGKWHRCLANKHRKWKDKPTRYKVENVAPLNTKYGDFGAFYSHKDHRHIIFTSARQESIGKGNDGGTGEKFQDLYEATVDKKGKWSSPKPLLEPVNSNSNDGSAAMDNKGIRHVLHPLPNGKR